MTRKGNSRHRGFTLIEVLVALAIVAFGLVAVFGQISQTASAASRLRDKTLAHWVAMNRLTELRLRGEFPAVGTQSDDVEMANIRWRYEITVAETASEDLRRADVTVAFEDQPERPVASAVAFLPKITSGSGLPGAGSGWPLVSPDGEAADAPGEDEQPPADAAPTVPDDKAAQ